jgi:2,3-bisphosphoglycerate-dependent phosphoglycerate mutase
MRLYFIRHGQSENNALWERSGSSLGRNQDPELTEVGRRQAAIIAERLRGDGLASTAKGGDLRNEDEYEITHVYTSLMVRAVATGEIIARALGLPLVGWKDLHEGGGIYLADEETGERVGLPGNNRAYFEVHYPGLVLPDGLGAEGWWNRPFEEREERIPRAKRFLQALLERHSQSEDRVAVISHGAFFNYLMAAILSLSAQGGFWFIMNNAAISRFDFYENEVAIWYVNRIDFMPKALIT